MKERNRARQFDNVLLVLKLFSSGRDLPQQRKQSAGLSLVGRPKHLWAGEPKYLEWKQQKYILTACLATKISCGTNGLAHTFETSGGSLPINQTFMLQIPVFAVQVLLAKQLAVLQLGCALVLQPSQHFLQLLVLFILTYSQIHCSNDVADLSQGTWKVKVFLTSLCGSKVPTDSSL